MKRLNFLIVTAFLAATAATQSIAQQAGEPLSAIPYLTEISNAGFNVKVRQTNPEPQPSVDINANKAPAVKTAVKAKPRPTAKPKTGSLYLGLSDDGHLTVNGVKSFLIKPLPVIISKKYQRQMTKTACVRRGATKVDLGYTVYTRDGVSLGYMVDYKLKNGSHFDSFRVVTFPQHFGQAKCLEFDGTNPYPNDRVKNQPKVKATMADLRVSGRFIR